MRKKQQLLRSKKKKKRRPIKIRRQRKSKTEMQIIIVSVISLTVFATTPMDQSSTIKAIKPLVSTNGSRLIMILKCKVQHTTPFTAVNIINHKNLIITVVLTSIMMAMLKMSKNQPSLKCPNHFKSTMLKARLLTTRTKT